MKYNLHYGKTLQKDKWLNYLQTMETLIRHRVSEFLLFANFPWEGAGEGGGVGGGSPD